MPYLPVWAVLLDLSNGLVRGHSRWWGRAFWRGGALDNPPQGSDLGPKRDHSQFQKGPAGMERGQYHCTHSNKSKIWNGFGTDGVIGRSDRVVRFGSLAAAPPRPRSVRLEMCCVECLKFLGCQYQ